jgi:hypothetical protein
MITKKNIFFFGLSVTIFLILLVTADSFGYCNRGSFCSLISDYLEPPVGSVLLVIPFVFIFSLVTYKMRDEVFQHWMKFARWAIPVAMVASFFISNIPHSSNIMSGMDKAFFYILTFGTFCTVSIWRITSKYLQLRGKK